MSNSQEPRIIFAADGKPFSTAQGAHAHITKKGLDASRYVAEQKGDGWVIAEVTGEVNSVHSVESSKAAKSRVDESRGPDGRILVGVEGFYKVRFHTKSTKNDDDDVHLGVNGETLQIQRNVVVIVPGRFLEAAEHGTHQHFIVEPGKDRKVQFEIVTYPYDMLGTATAQEYAEFKKTGVCTL